MDTGLKIGFIITVIIMLGMIINHIVSDKEEVYQKCYDRFSNEIIGEKCIEERLVEPHYLIENILFLLLFINFFVTILILIPLHLKKSSCF